jgi:hypothetical protein
MINQLYRSVKAEMLKYRGTYAMALAVLAPLFISLLMAVIYFIKAEKLVRTGTNGLTGMLDGGVNASATMLFTFYLVMLTILIHQVEYRAHALKDVFSYPVSHFSTYISKWFVAFILTGVSVALYFIFSLLFTWVVELRHPSLVWFDKVIFIHFMKQVCIVMIASLLLLGIQFLVALRWSNTIVPLGTGVVGFISAIILAQGWKHVDMHPYALGLLSYMRTMGRSQFTLNHIIAYSILGLVCMMAGGYFMWTKRRIV